MIFSSPAPLRFPGKPKALSVRTTPGAFCCLIPFLSSNIMRLSYKILSGCVGTVLRSRVGSIGDETGTSRLRFRLDFLRKNKKRPDCSKRLCWHLPIFPGRRQPSIVGTTELNFCVRNGNRWTLCVNDTNFRICSSHTLHPPYADAH